MNPSLVIYLASPYSHNDASVVESRMNAVTRKLAELAAKGNVAVSPLLMHYCLNSGIELPGDFAFWENYCLTLLEKCDRLYVLRIEGYEDSPGVCKEIEFATRNKIPVTFIDP